MATKQAPAGIMQRRFLFTTSDDNMMMKQIEATHAPDSRLIDVKPLLHVVEDIFNLATPSIDTIVAPATQLAHVEALEDKTHQAGYIDLPEALSYIINRVSSEMKYKCSGGGDAHATTVSVLNMLTSYSWDAKMVLALSAFVVNYGQFWLAAQFHTSNQLAKSLAILKQLPEILEHSKMLKPQFDAIIKATLDVTKCLINFKELPSDQYITTDLPALSNAMAHTPVAAYWTIRSIVACASQIANLTLLGHEYIASTAEAWELLSLAHKLSNIHSHLADQLNTCHKHLDEKKHIEAYQTLLRLFDMTHIDNMEVLKALIYAKDDLQPLVDGAAKRRVNIDALRRKHVLLLISDLDISHNELSILEQIYNETRLHPTRPESQYEVVWLPILDHSALWTETKQIQFENLQATMPWYTVHHPSLIDRTVIKFIKEVWHFRKKPILVVLDPQGQIACPNALHMMWIWRSSAFPFTTLREEALWKEETWRLELLVDSIDALTLNWISEGRFICLYGGEDIEWIRKFTTAAGAVAKAAGISLGMVYVGKINPKERVQWNISTINVEKLSHCLQDLTSIWYFWFRIESMWQSKMQLGKTVENDPVMQEIMTMISFDGSDGGWAVLSRESTDITKAKGGTFLKCLSEYDLWKDHVQPKGFIPALRDHLLQLHSPHHCSRLVLPSTAGSIPERVACSECGRSMERSIMYQCCD